MSGSLARREGHLLMENSISQIQADVSSMRGKYKAAVMSRSDSVSPVFSPGDSPPGGEGHAVATPKQLPARALQQSMEDGRRDLLRSRSVAVRSVVGKSNSTPTPTMSTPMSRPKQSVRGTVEFSSSDDENDPSLVGDRMSTPESTESGLLQTSRRLEWTPPMSARDLPARSLSLSQFEDQVQSSESLSATLMEEAQMHRMVLRLEELFSAQEHRGRQPRLRAAERTIPQTPRSETRSETRYEKLERLTAEESKSSGSTSRVPPSPTMRAASGSDSAFVGLVPPYGEPYSPYARRTAGERPHHVSSTQSDTTPTPTLRAAFRSSSQQHQQRRKPGKKETKDKRVPKSASASSASKRERTYPYEGAKTWRESCRVRGPLSRYPLHEAPTSDSVQVGSVKSGGYVEVLRTEIGRGFGSRDESSAMWVLLAQGGWLRVASQYCSPSYGEWLTQGGDGTGLTSPERGPIAVLQTFQRPGRGKPFVSGRQGMSSSSKSRESTKHNRPFYT